MNLGELIEVLQGMIDNGVKKESLVFVPQEEEENIVHSEAAVMLVNLGEEGEQDMGIVLYPFDAEYYKNKELEEPKEDRFEN